MGYDDFYIEPSEVYLDGSGGYEIVQLNNTSGEDAADGWSLNCNSVVWCTMSIENAYSNNTIITISADENPTNEIRQLEVQVLFNGQYMGDLYIEQAEGTSGGNTGGSNTGTTGNTGTTVVRETSVGDSSLSVGSGEGSSDSTTLTANYDCNWSCDYTVNWLEAYINNNGTKNAILVVITTQANSSTTNRTGKVYVTDEDGEEYTIQVTQEGGAQSSSISPAVIEAGSNGDTYYVSLEANYAANWSVDSEPSWVSATITKNSTTNGEVRVIVYSNDSAEDRKGTIVLSNNHRTHNITVMQDGATQIYDISTTSMNFGSGSATKTTTLSSNGYALYSVHSKPDWCSVDFEDNGSDSVTANVTVNANYSVEDRMGDVEFTPDNGFNILTVTVTQDGIEKETSISTTATTIGSGVSETASVSLTANYNCNWDTNSTVSWLDVEINSNETENATLVITTTQENPKAYTRMGKVNVSDDMGNEWIIQVTQTAAGKSSSVSPASFDLVKGGETRTATLISNWDTYWEITQNGSWCTAKISNNGGQNGTLTLTAGENPYAGERTDRIIVKNDYRSHNVDIRQDAGDWVYSVYPTSLSFGVNAATKSVELTANGSAYYTTYSKPDWCEIAFEGNGSDSVTANVTVNANSSVEDRMGYVVFTPNNGVNKLTITVSQSAVDRETSISATATTIGSGISETASVSLTANYNCDWNAESTVSWLDVSISNDKTQNATLIITVTQENPKAYTRMGKVNVNDDMGNEWIVQVTQTAAGKSSSVTPASFDLVKGGDTKTATLISNWDTYWEITQNGSWCTARITDNGGQNGTLTLTAGKNPYAGERTDRIIVKNDYRSHNVDIRQDAGDWVYSVYPTSLVFGVNAATKSVELTANGYAHYTTYSKPDWCEITFEDNGSDSVTGKISVTNNDTVDIRSNTVVFTPNGGVNKLSVSIAQDGIEKETSISTTATTIGSGVSETASVSLTANYNCDWNADSTVSWLDVSISNDKTHNATLIITTTQENPKAYTRMGKVNVNDDMGNEWIVQVTQTAAGKSSSVSPASFDMLKGGDTKTATLISNWDTYWEITSKPDWCTARITDNGGQSGTLTLTAEKNPYAGERNGRFILKNDYRTHNVDIRQDSGDWVYSVYPTSLSFGVNSATKSVDLTANGYAHYTTYSKPDWCSVDFEDNGGENVIANITVTNNDTIDSRTGTIEFTPNGGVNKLSITVSQSAVDRETSISTNAVSIGSGVTRTATVTLTANYNCDWTFDSTVNWLEGTISNDKTYNATLTITTTQANPKAATRMGKVYVTDDIGNEYLIQVTQDKGDVSSSVVPQLMSDINKNGETRTATLISNWDTYWEVTSKPDWVSTYISDNGGQNATLSVVINSNARAEERTGNIAIKNNIHSFGIKLMQDAADYVYSINPTSLSYGNTGGTQSVTLTANGYALYRVYNKPDWCEITFEDNGSDSVTGNITVSPNTVSDNRQGVVQFTPDTGVNILEVNIIQGGKTYKVEPTEIVAAGTGGTYEITCTSTDVANWMVLNRPESFIWYSWDNQNSANATLTLTLKENTLNRQQNGSVVISADNGAYTISIPVKQLSKSAVNINPTYFNINEKAQTLTVTANTNYDTSWTATKSEDWMTVATACYMPNYEWFITINVTEHKKVEPRTGYVYAKDASGETHTIEIVQQLKPECKLTPTSFGEIEKNATVLRTNWTANYNCEWSINNPTDWISVNYNNNQSAGTITFTINENKQRERTGSISLSTQYGFTHTFVFKQKGKTVPQFSDDFWSVPPMFMDGTDSIYYTNNSGETQNSDEVKIDRNTGKNNHSLCSTPYYDSDIRLCFKDGENKPVDGADVLVFYNSPVYFADDFWERYAVYLTDDTPEMLRLNDGKPCWIYNQSIINDNLGTVLEYPQFSRYMTDGKTVTDSLNIGNPIKTFTLDHSITPDTDIYSRRWKKYLEDQYSRDTRIMECYVKLPFGIMQDYLRNFFYFDSSYWCLIEVNDYSLTTEKTTKCKFIKVNDIDNYL